MMRRLLVLILVVFALLTGCAQEADAPEDDDAYLAEGIEVTGVPRVSICHATGLRSLPYLQVELSEEAVATHREHAGDLIPAPAEGCPAGESAIQSHTAMPSDTTVPVETVVPTTTNPPSSTIVPSTSVPTTTAEPVTVIPTVAATASVAATADAATPDQSCDLDGALSTALADVEGVTRFQAMLNESGLIELVHAEQVTIFVPTDEAFDRLDPALVAEWDSNPSARNAMLLYHIVHGHRQYNSIENAQRLNSYAGESIFVSEADGIVTLNNSAQFVTTDLEACNDMIHVIDNVLIPPIFTYQGAGRPDRGNSNGNKNGNGNNDGGDNGNGNGNGNKNGNGNNGGDNGNGNGNGNP